MKNTSRRSVRTTRIASAVMLATLFVGHSVANAMILFQDDSFHDIPSEAILIDNDGAGANDTSIQFGNDAVSSENGTINWDITSNEFQFDHTVDITGDLDVSGNADFTDATEFHIREVANEAAADCTTVDELVLDTAENRIYVCTVVGSPGTWVGADASSGDDFESVYTNDGDDTLTTSGGDFSIAPGAGEFDVTSTGLIDFNPGSFDLATGTGDITLTSADDIIFNDAQLGSAIQLTDTATGIDATYGTTGIIDALNTLTTTTTGEGASNVGIEDAGTFFTGTNVEAALQELGTATTTGSSENEVLTFYPEYPDAVIFQDGTSNRGRLDSDYDDTNDEHLYKWTTRRATAQDIDIRFRFPLPDDFSDVNDFTFRYRTGTAVEADNDVEIGVYNATNETAGDPTLCGADTTNNSANTWTTGTITEATLETGCTGGTALDAGDVIEVLVKLIDATSASATFADIGFLTLDYDN